MEPKIGDTVTLSLPVADKPYTLGSTTSATGIVVGIKPNGLDDDTELGGLVYQIAILAGFQDAHRNQKGELWVNRNEIS